MSSMTAWLSGTSAAPNTPCSSRNADHLLDRLRDAAQHRGEGEAGGADDEQLLAAEPHRRPAERRGHDRGGDDVGGQHPVDLVLRRRQRTLHVGQGDVGDRGVERLHDGGHHHADRQQAALQRADFAPDSWGRVRLGRLDPGAGPGEKPGLQPLQGANPPGVDGNVGAHAGAQARGVLIGYRSRSAAGCAARP